MCFIISVVVFPTCHFWQVKKRKYRDHSNHVKQFKLTVLLRIVSSSAVDDNKSLVTDNLRRCLQLFVSLHVIAEQQNLHKTVCESDGFIY